VPGTNNGGAQGAFVSSGAPANTSGPQKAFFSSGAPRNTAGSQPVDGDVSGVLPEDQETKLARIESAANSGSVERLRGYLHDTDASVQASAFYAWFANDDAGAIRQLFSIIGDRAQVTRLQALELLNNSAQVDDQIVRAALRSVAADPDPLLQQYARTSLAVRDATASSQDSGGPSSQGPFVSSGGARNTGRIQGAFASSGAPENTSGAQPAMPVSGVSTPLTEDQEAKLAEIDKTGDDSTRGLLRQYLGDPDPAVQSAAFEKLSAVDITSAVQDLLEVFRDSQQLARSNALRLLVNSPQVDEHVVRAELRRGARDSDPAVRQYANEALARLDSQ